jgi:hypothetical protein
MGFGYRRHAPTEVSMPRSGRQRAPNRIASWKSMPDPRCSSGQQHVCQWNERSTSYRSTGEAVKHERYLYLAAAGPGAGATDRVGLLAERVEGLLLQENARWTSSQDKARESAGRAAAAVSRLGTRQ